MDGKKHHFVPQWYLRQFGTRTTIGVFDKQTREFAVRHPRNVAFIEGLYDIDHPGLERASIEDLLAEVESRAATAIRRLAASGLESMTGRDRTLIADYVAAQHLRVPAHRTALARAVHRRLDRERARLTDDEISELAGQPLTPAQRDLIRGPQMSPKVVDGVVGGGLMIHLAEHSYDLRSSRWTWSLERVDEPILVTSDVPVSVVSPDLATRNTGYADLPLDPSTVLVFRCGETALEAGSSRDFYLNRNGQASAKHFQRLMLIRSDRWIFGHPDNPLWAALR